MKSKSTATILAYFLGSFGVHKFYLGESGTGTFYLMFFWTGIPFFLGIIQGRNLRRMSQAAFDARYNGRALFVAGVAGIQQQSTNVVVNVAPPIGYGPPASVPQHAHVPAAGAATGDVAARISALHDLKVAGALTEAEFTAAKQKLLMTSGGT